MLKDVSWSKTATYQTDSEHDPVEFFTQALLHSTSFDLQLGYFNSAAISVLSYGFAHFIANGGNMRMAINQVVSKQDKETIIMGLSDDPMSPYDLTDLKKLKSTLDEYGLHFFECLAYMIQQKRIQIKIIRPIGKSGIEHKKLGIFDDGKMKVAFTVSANFTIGGLINNHEDIQVSFSTSPDETIQNRIADIEEKFDALMQGGETKVKYLDASELEEAIASEFGGTDIDELVDVENQLAEVRQNERRQVADANEIKYNEPHFPFESGPRDYQQEAYINWKNNGQKGLFAMATGTGKTLTALNVLLHIYNSKRYYKAIILVPTIPLLEQWEIECRKFQFNNVLRICSKNSNWEKDLSDLIFRTNHKPKDKEVSFIIITTYFSFAREKVFNALINFPANQVLLIADEAHNMGAASLVKRLSEIPYLRRIGLSATPQRQFDDSGNKKILRFFGAEDKYTYEYSMEEAINNGILCSYRYYPHLVELTDDEMEKYQELSVKISRYYNAHLDSFEKPDEMLKLLLLARKRILHKAENKILVFKNIIKDWYTQRGSLKYTLIYTPEGNAAFDEDADLFDNRESILYDGESEHLIEKYTKVVAEIDPKVTVRMFSGETKDRESILKGFSDGRIQVLTSMKCLDEGVDVPRSEMAIFCSSTGNPRQFIQRRGRVLRTHPEKKEAILHDLVVIPKIEYGSPSFKMEQSMLKGELARVYDFAILSKNTSDSYLALQDVMNYYGVPLKNN